MGEQEPVLRQLHPHAELLRNSPLASSGIPQGDELKLLEPYRKELPPALFTEPFKLPVTDGSGNNREQLRHALDLLQQAGWSVKERKLVDKTGNQMSFTILLDEPSLERVALPYVQLLQKLGIDARVRTVDPAQYQHLTDDFDFDMIMMIYPEGDIPGNELRGYFSCAAAKAQGSFNTAGDLRSGGRCADRADRHGAGPRDADHRGARAGPGAAVALVSWCRTGTAGSSTSPIGTASAIRTSRSARGSTSTRGGWTRRNPRRSPRQGSSDADGSPPPTPSRKGRGSSRVLPLPLREGVGGGGACRA